MAAFAPPYGRGSRGQHFTGFQYQPPGRQPFGLKVKSPRAFGPAPLPEGGPWDGRPSSCPGAQKAAWNRCESSGGPGCRAPREAQRFAELPTALPGGERRLGTGHETNGGPSRSPPGPRAFFGRPAPSGQVGPHGGTSPPMCPPALRGGFQFPQPGGRRNLRAGRSRTGRKPRWGFRGHVPDRREGCGGYPAPSRPLSAAESGPPLALG